MTETERSAAEEGPSAPGHRTPGVDPVTLEVIKGLIRSARAEMASLVERTAMSESIREKLDYFVAMFDRRGRMIYGTNLPLGANILDAILEQYPAATMKPGDLYWYNDCYASRGGVSHTPDLVVAAPVFVGDELVAFSQAWGHLQDIGGIAPGSNSPFATEIYHEGVLLPPTLLERDGMRNDELFRVFVRQSRFPTTLKGDVRALIAAVRVGERRLAEIGQRFGTATALAAFEGLIEQTATAVRASLAARVPDGTYLFEDWIDGDAYQERSYAVRVAMRKRGDDLSLDFTDSDDQARGTINFLMDQSVPKLMLGLYAIADQPSLLMNDGCVRAIGAVRVREGSILQPRFPAPLGQRAATFLRVNSCLFGALGQATDGQAPASSPYFVIVSLRWSDPARGPGFAFDGLATGHGARPFADGHDAIYYVAQRDMPVEYSEQEFPFRIEQYAIHRDSGGPGLYRGGCGIVRDYRILCDGVVARHTMDNVLHPPWGARGGQSGRPGAFILNPGTPRERRLPSKGDNLALSAGDLLRVQTCGGGGWGDPRQRDPRRVLHDVRGGFVSRASAECDYGVVITPDLSLDEAGTARLRAGVP